MSRTLEIHPNERVTWTNLTDVLENGDGHRLGTKVRVTVRRRNYDLIEGLVGGDDGGSAYGLDVENGDVVLLRFQPVEDGC